MSIPAGPGLAWGIEGKPAAVRLLALAAVVAIATGILSTIAIMYQARAGDPAQGDRVPRLGRAR
jgi:hypothetical protein